MMQCCFTPCTGPKEPAGDVKEGTPGKVNATQPDPSCFRLCIQEQDWQAYQANLYCKSLKCLLKVVLLHTYHPDGSGAANCLPLPIRVFPGLTFGTTYHLRFQIEFLYRDAKQLSGPKALPEPARQPPQLPVQLLSLTDLFSQNRPLPLSAPYPQRRLLPARH